MDNNTIEVTIIGAPIACKEGVKDAWRDVAHWAFMRLRAKYGDRVVTRYYDLFDPDCPQFPPGSQLPIIFVNGNIFSSGEKISIPKIKKELEALTSVY